MEIEEAVTILKKLNMRVFEKFMLSCITGAVKKNNQIFIKKRSSLSPGLIAITLPSTKVINVSEATL